MAKIKTHLRKIFFITLFTSLFFIGKSQTEQSIVLDIGGIASYGSLNYERSFFSKNNYTITGKVGFSFYRFRDYERDLNPDFFIPLSIQAFRNWKSHSAVFGIGQTFSSLVQASRDFKKIRNNGLSGSIILGYRFRKEESRFAFQIAYTPIFEHYERFQNWGGLSISYFLK